MMKKIISMLICFLMIAGGSSEAAGLEKSAGEGKESSPATAIILSESALDPLIKPKFNLPEEERAKQKEDDSINKDNVPENCSSKQFSSHDLDLLARLVQAEAGGEPFSGKVAIAATVLNRVESSRYPNTLPAVIYQVNYGYQYCPVRNGTINRPAGKEACRAVQEALRGNDPTGGALSFYNPVKTSNTWILTRPVFSRIGNHVFVC